MLIRKCTVKTFFYDVSSVNISTELTNVMLPVHNSTFKELNHHLSKMPDLVTVRVLLDSGYMSDGQGNMFIFPYLE